MRNTPYLLAALLAMLACAGCPVYQSQNTPVEELQRVQLATKTTYFLYVPSDYNPEQAYPLVVTLHGTHGFDEAHQQVREWKALAEKNKFLVLAVQVLSPQGILPVPHSQRMRDLQHDDDGMLACLQEVKAHYHIDDKAVALTSFSAGGYPMYYTGMKHPELFSAMIARGADWDEPTVRDIPIRPELQQMPIYIFFGHTGVSPVTSTLDPLTSDSWKAYRYLHEHGCKALKIKSIRGGHERRPEIAWEWWKTVLAKQRRAATR